MLYKHFTEKLLGLQRLNIKKTEESEKSIRVFAKNADTAANALIIPVSPFIPVGIIRGFVLIGRRISIAR